MNDAMHYLTAGSLEELKKELINLKDYKIPEIAKRIDEAKQQGDLSENAEYHQAREDMSWARGRLQELEQIINNAQIIIKKKSNVVTVGSTITIEVNGSERQYTIVGPQEANPVQGFISNESPLGAAFLNHEAGDSVEVNVPAGKVIYKIKTIK